MNFFKVQPTGILQNYIRHYCFMESGVNDMNVIERVIPTENVQLMFHFRNPFVVLNSSHDFKEQPRSIISGLSDGYSDVSTNGEAGVIFVVFYPAGACHFFNFPLSEIENMSLDLTEIFNMQIKEIEEKLYYSRTVAAKVAVIETFLQKCFSPIPSYDHLIIKKGLDLIKNCGARITSASLCENLYVTPKSLERKFSQYLGKTTKQVIKLMRFQEILSDFSMNKNHSLTEIAYRNGFYDQSHFIRDFKSYSGYTPKEFTAKYPGYNIHADYC